MCITRSLTSPEGGIWEIREVIQIGDTLKVAVFHFLTRSYVIRTNVLSDSSESGYLFFIGISQFKVLITATSPVNWVFFIGISF